RAIKEARSGAGKTQALEPLCDRIDVWTSLGMRVGIIARTQTQLDRIVQLLSHRGVSVQSASEREGAAMLSSRDAGPRVVVVSGSLSRGVVAPTERLVLVTEEEIFGARAARQRRRAGGASNANSARAFLEDLKSLSVGDFVVHVEHGIGRYH